MPDSSTLPPVRRCTCGHVLDWHWTVGQTGGVVLNPTSGNRCADMRCPCDKPTWDGEPPFRLKPVVMHPPLGDPRGPNVPL